MRRPRREEIAQSLQNVVRGINPGADDIETNAGKIVFRLGRHDLHHNLFYSCSSNGLYFLQNVPMNSQDVQDMISMKKEVPSHISLQFAFVGKERIRDPHYTTYFVADGQIGSERGYASTVMSFELPDDFVTKAQTSRSTVHDMMQTSEDERSREMDNISTFVANVRAHMKDTVQQMGGGGDSDSDESDHDDVPIFDEGLLDLIEIYLENHNKYAWVDVFFYDDDFFAIVNSDTNDAIFCSQNSYVMGPGWLNVDSIDESHDDRDELFADVIEYYRAKMSSRPRSPPPAPKRRRYDPGPSPSLSLRKGGSSSYAGILTGVAVVVASALMSAFL